MTEPQVEIWGWNAAVKQSRTRTHGRGESSKPREKREREEQKGPSVFRNEDLELEL